MWLIGVWGYLWECPGVPSPSSQPRHERDGWWLGIEGSFNDSAQQARGTLCVRVMRVAASALPPSDPVFTRPRLTPSGIPRDTTQYVTVTN
jgi:hypothetical protein